ncbi:MAG: hypothetical protein ACREBS_03735 [Nitrososphaerales archaeon]
MNESIAGRSKTKLDPNYLLPKVSFLSGIVLFTISNFFYAANMTEFNKYNASASYSFTSLFLVILASAMLAVSALSYLSVERKIPPAFDDNSKIILWSIERIIADTLFGEKRIVIVASATYAVFFAFLDGILIYQPSVNFFFEYVVNGPTWRIVSCCGLPGYVPVGLLYLPAQHIGLQLVPLSVLIMLLVSILVGLNVALLYRAFMQTKRFQTNVNKVSGTRGAAGGAVGAIFGLFAGCPTCAATFFVGMIAGSGATIFSTVVSEYQPVIVALTLPILFASIYWQARSFRTILQGCAV